MVSENYEKKTFSCKRLKFPTYTLIYFYKKLVPDPSIDTQIPKPFTGFL